MASPDEAGVRELALPAVGWTTRTVGWHLATRSELLAVGAVGAVYFSLYAWLSVRRHQTFHSFGPDLGLFDQVFWNTVHGRFLESTMSLGLQQPHTFFSDHFSPALLILVPLYAAFPRPETLVVFQAAALSLGACPVYLAARDRLPPGYQRLLWVVAYFLFVPLAHMTLYDFHEITLAVPLLGFAIYFADRGRMAWFWLVFAALLLVKEELALTGVAVGVFIVLRRRRAWRLGLAVSALSVAWFVAVTAFVIPSLGHGRGYVYFAQRYGELGGSPVAAVQTMLTQPLRVAHLLLERQKVAFLVALFGPVLAVNLLAGWRLLLAVPPLSYLLLSSYPPEYSISNHYAAPLVPLVLITAVWGFARLPARWRPAGAVGILAGSLLFAFALGDLPGSAKFQPADFSTEPRYVAFAPQLALIPPGASVAAENNLTPHLSHRTLIFDLEYEGTAGADYVVLDYAATGRDARRFAQQVGGVVAQGYRLLASGPGLALLIKRGGNPGSPHGPTLLSGVMAGVE
jgi:uncharacterized membrane protein